MKEFPYDLIYYMLSPHVVGESRSKLLKEFQEVWEQSVNDPTFGMFEKQQPIIHRFSQCNENIDCCIPNERKRRRRELSYGRRHYDGTFGRPRMFEGGVCSTDRRETLEDRRKT